MLTRRWPPPRSPLAMTKGERWRRRVSLAAILFGPVATAWSMPPLTLVFAGLTGLGILVYAGTLAWWVVREERGWVKVIGFGPLLIVSAAAGGATTAVMIYVAAVLARAAIG